MADCTTLLDEELESFVFNYLTDSPEPGVEPLSLDFPEIDLSPLDANDFDSNSCFNELQWYNDHSEAESSQYSTDDSALLQIIDSENEALLAALTQTLDDIQDDDIGLCAFVSSEDENVCPSTGLLPKPSLAELPMSPESEDELSILKKLLLSPAQTPITTDSQKDGSTRRQGPYKFRPHRAYSKAESSTERQPAFPQAQNKSCTELHRHLVSSPCGADAPSKDGSQDSTKEEDSDSYEEEHSEDDSTDALLMPSPEEHKPQFTCEKEKRAVVDLIRYMHTYCLPLKKHQHCNGLLKRTKLGSSVHTQSCSNQERVVHSGSANGSCISVGKYRESKTVTRFSILKELLAKEICGDVSKPYRLAQPIYAEFSNSSGSTELERQKEARGSRNFNPELTNTYKPCLNLKSVNTEKENELGKSTNTAQENLAGKTARKQDHFAYAVRRSSRLNPEFGELFFQDESSFITSLPKGNITVDFLLADGHLCLTTKDFVAEEEVAVEEVGELVESIERILQEDVFSRNTDEAHIVHSIENTNCHALSSQNVSEFGKRNFEQPLTVELCGTAGLTPPTTPPYKPTEEDFKPEPIKTVTLIRSPSRNSVTEDYLSANKKTAKKHPERTELFAHLSRTEDLPAISESQGIKRPFSRSFGDHDYCQVIKADTTIPRKLIRSVDVSSYIEKKSKQVLHPVHPRNVERKTEQTLNGDSKHLKDHEIRASLTKHFGFPDHTLKDETDILCNSPEYDSVFDDSGSEYSSPIEDDSCFSPIRNKLHSQRNISSKSKRHCYSLNSGSHHSSRDRPRDYRYESFDQESKHMGQMHIQRKREKAIIEGRMIYIRNLSNSISANELKRRFEVFGEIIECSVLSKNRGEKYGFITYQYPEHAALSLKKGASLRKRNEPSFHLSYGGLKHFFRTKYTDLDSNAVEPSKPLKKSKYESMDFDSLLKEAQRSLHR
ncbi:hypothetical protein GDO86_005502 [Hymenochirus boettgeri]|uniref:RRM domain-containing protein n=1 Tax=Hymenochirus boettgeri TaxID=247094 RepID=A0A8T2J771_9PIPI|nr:hypothetical protein GDO86_005502 [Hymenochirus boettgeri]